MFPQLPFRQCRLTPPITGRILVRQKHFAERFNMMKANIEDLRNKSYTKGHIF